MANRSHRMPGLMRYGANDVARFYDYADAEADWFWEIDSNFQFTIVLCRHEGRSSIRENDLLGKTPWSFANVDPDSDPAWQDFVGKLKRSEAFREFRICVHVDGESQMYWRLSGKPMVGDDGTFFGYRGIATDETVEALRRGQVEALASDYQSILQSFDSGVAYFNNRARLMFANAQFRNLLPVRAGGLKPGRKFSDVIDSIADLLSLDTSVSLLSEVPVRQTATWTRKDGTEVLGEVRPLPSGGMH